MNLLTEIRNLVSIWLSIACGRLNLKVVLCRRRLRSLAVTPRPRSTRVQPLPTGGRQDISCSPMATARARRGGRTNGPNKAL